MNSAIERLLSLRVQDVMSKHVLTLGVHQNMCEAAAKLTEKGVSGAPVVDESQRCVGVLSTTDFVMMHLMSSFAEPLAGREHTLQAGDDGTFHVEDVCEEAVSRHMSSGVQSIAGDATLMQAARIMYTEHVHRLPVLDSAGHVLGVLSSLDIVAALIHAIEE